MIGRKVRNYLIFRGRFPTILTFAAECCLELVLPVLPALEDEVLDFLDVDFDLYLVCFGLLTGALGGSKRSSMTKTTPSSVSELLVLLVTSG